MPRRPELKAINQFTEQGVLLDIAPLIAEFAAGEGRAARAAEQAAIFVIVLGLQAVDVTPGQGQVKISIDPALQIQPKHVRLQPLKVGLFIAVEAARGKEMTGVIDRHAAQPRPAKILPDMIKAQDRRGGRCWTPFQVGRKDLVFLVGIEAKGVGVFIGRAEAHEPAAMFVHRPAKLAAPAMEIKIAPHGAQGSAEFFPWRAGHIVDQTAGLTAAEQGPGRPLDDFHRFNIEQERHGKARKRIAQQPVIADFILAEAPEGHAGIAEHGDRGNIAVKIGDLDRGLVLDQLFRQDLD